MRRRGAQQQGRRSAAAKRWHRRIWSNERRRIKRGGKPNPQLARPGKLFWIRVRAPEIVDVSDAFARGPTTSFLSDLRAGTRREGVGVIIDLSSVSVIRPTGAVLLLAEMDRALAGQSLSSLQVIRCADPVADAVMTHIGIYATSEGPTPEADRDDVKHWRAATGVASEGAKGGSILEDYAGRLADGLTGDLYAGIVEAMTNTVHHASEETMDLR